MIIFASWRRWDLRAPYRRGTTLGKANYRVGVLFRWKALWTGAHWSSKHRRLCVNLIPFVTVWFTIRGGDAP